MSYLRRLLEIALVEFQYRIRWLFRGHGRRFQHLLTDNFSEVAGLEDGFAVLAS